MKFLILTLAFSISTPVFADDSDEKMKAGAEASQYIKENMSEMRNQGCYMVFSKNSTKTKKLDQKWFDVKVKQMKSLSPRAAEMVDKMQVGYGLALLDVFGAKKAILLCQSKT
ncbi:MAG: hypothetical protein ACI88H_002549 [Cocleimonas sp.]|jgi:hypothetical protein